MQEGATYAGGCSRRQRWVGFQDGEPTHGSEHNYIHRNFSDTVGVLMGYILDVY